MKKLKFNLSIVIIEMNNEIILQEKLFQPYIINNLQLFV